MREVADVHPGFVLLHHFIKKTQKTPVKEIDQAKRNLKDFLDKE
ncbi:MAG: type II toxin-antitoxin system RelE/ParE family toxin [Synergistaceae bacterium]|nr:type II toxin-antitoxin system RelE/ParE family toxin [Synergistaceae bacterium]